MEIEKMIFHNLNRAIFISSLVMLLSGCLLNKTDTAVIDAKNASFPLKEGTYYSFNAFDIGSASGFGNALFNSTSTTERGFIDSHTTTTERELIATNQYIPDIGSSITIAREKHCYIGKEKEENDIHYYVFEKVEGNVYLMSMQVECVNRGEKTDTTTLMITIADDEIYGMDISQGTESSALDEMYNKWALSLNKFDRWTNGVYINEDKPQSSSTKSYKSFYHQHQSLITAVDQAFLTPHSNLNKYKPALILLEHLRKQFENEQNTR